jgi:hypothetical protein
MTGTFNKLGVVVAGAALAILAGCSSTTHPIAPAGEAPAFDASTSSDSTSGGNRSGSMVVSGG